MDAVGIFLKSLRLDIPQLLLLGIVVLVIFVLVYYLLFGRKSQTPAWKQKSLERFRTLQLQEKNRDKKLVLIDLDKFLEHVLQQQFRQKESLGSLLKTNKKKFSKQSLNEIWEAHKLRNKLVHDVDSNPNPSELNFAIIALKKALRNILDE